MEHEPAANGYLLPTTFSTCTKKSVHLNPKNPEIWKILFLIFIIKYCKFFPPHFSIKSQIFDFSSEKREISFEVYNDCVAQKLQISEFLIKLFFAWILATSATSYGCNFNLIDFNRVSNLMKINFPKMGWFQLDLFCKGTIYLRRRQIFMIFDPYPPPIGNHRHSSKMPPPPQKYIVDAFRAKIDNVGIL